MSILVLGSKIYHLNTPTMASSSSCDSHETLEQNQLEHFLHDHPLTFFENAKEHRCSCEICSQFMLDGPMYGCISCSFYVHKSCSELPKQVRNMLHPQHLLELSELHIFECEACNDISESYSYLCVSCDFNLDIRCVLEYTFEEPRGHKEHKFKILKPVQFTCDACGLEGKNNCIWVCTICQLQVHRKCTDKYLFTVKEPRHSHLLSLTYSFQADPDFSNKICKICFRKMNDVLFMYSCAGCAYFTHVKCGARTNTLDNHDYETENKVFSPNTLESKETLQQVGHFSNPHTLTLNIDELKNVILCDGCVRPISEPFYSCERCNFFLHQYCIRLNEKIRHPLHVHELTLVSARDNEMQIGIKCYGCRFLCNGLMYSCKKCKFFLDIGCSFLPDTLSHEGHKCALTLIDMKERHKSVHPDYETKCSACDLNCLNKFICEGCNFNLDLQCASLPKMIPHQCPKHDWNLHPFELTYYSIEDGRGKFYCDVCEKERNENYWFYYCQDCDYSAHPRCILGHDRVKHKSLGTIKDHRHRVRFLETTYQNHTCETCSKPCKNGQPAYTCEECDAHFHLFCASQFVVA